jgi:hypothetical protein
VFHLCPNIFGVKELPNKIKLLKMKAKWIIENFTDTEDYRTLAQAVRDSGRYVYVIGKNNHFDFAPAPGTFQENDCVIVQGSIQMTKHIAGKLPAGCFPIAYSSWQNYLCTSYYQHFERFLFNDIHRCLSVGDLKACKFEIYRQFGRDAMIFIRPDSGEKTFQAQVLDLQDFDRFWENGISGGGNVEDSDLVIVSTPKNINGEWRFVCSGEEIIAQSTYQYQKKRTLIPSAPVGATDKVREILKVRYKPDPIFCVDIAEDSDGNFWLLELTSFSSAGLYATDKNRVAQRVSEIVESEYAIDKSRKQ